MHRSIIFLLLLLPLPLTAASLPFINELHYDNDGTDVGEGVEIAGMAGVTLEGWSLLFYNGNNGAIYRTVMLDGIIPDQVAGYGTLFFATGALQNGAPDGVALVDGNNAVAQFLSYEGAFVALEGAAGGMPSTDIGVAESPDTPAGWSLQLTGSGASYPDFSWAAGPDSFGSVNAGQNFAVVPLPASLPLLGSGLMFLLRRRKCAMT